MHGQSQGYRRVDLKTTNTKAVLILTGCLAGYLIAGVAARLSWGPSVDNLLVAAIVAASLPLVLLLLLRPSDAEPAKQKNHRAEMAEALLHSTSPMVLATAMDGSFTYLNPSSERILGIRSSDLIGKAKMLEIFAPGEMERISQWLRKLHPDVSSGPAAPADPSGSGPPVAATPAATPAEEARKVRRPKRLTRTTSTGSVSRKGWSGGGL